MVGKNFIRIQKSLTIREKMDKLKFFNFKNVFSSKDAIKKKKRQAASREKIFAIHKSDK